ncbi:hypothetical protein RFI_30933 [Reticulomyxa filosa]|uniref:Uncharacterized protein n=2 Tax=Reticulomyxa filosa TaxID=46433 RepID=X6LXY2_RETFI|nr:hypothetical protein RFI_30933 [Reticulomyxa filosa]|eukprot:ETO06459.1 hypothetical protein RFI_30933 [Reticulomyxa filosa]
MIGYNVYLYRQSYLYDVQDKQAVGMLGLRKMVDNNHFETQNLEELKAIMQYCHDNKLKIKPVGKGIYFYKKSGEKGERKDIFGKQKNIQIFLTFGEKNFKMTYTVFILFYFIFVISFPQQKKE